MTVDHSTAPAPSSKEKSHPLTLHPTGQFCKKIRGKIHYFGKDLEAALERWEAEKDDLLAGRTPKPETDSVTVAYACNSFLQAKEEAVSNGELSPRSFDDYVRTCKAIAGAFGKGRLAADLRPADFATLRKKLAGSVGPVRLGNEIQRTRSVFKYAYDSELLDKPVRFGPGFKRPSKKVLRLHKAEKGKKLFTVEEILRLLDAASTPMRAMILLGINCGFGNADCGSLPLAALDLDNAMIDSPRPKTGVARRCPLWTETVDALREWLAARPNPKSDEHALLVFITKRGLCWNKDKPDSPVSKEMAKLLRKLGINGRQGLGFYTLRHTFRTVADESKDQPAVDLIMGHEVSHMSSHYRETIADERLRVVSHHVHDWLFPPR
jgi:integrase